MSNQVIRQIAVQTVVNDDNSKETFWKTMVYTVGQVREIPIEGQKVKRKLTSIIREKDCFKLYITNEETTQEWIDIPATDKVTVYYFIT